MFDIRCTDKPCAAFYNRSVFEFIYNNPSADAIPESIMSTYITELNYNYQTPLMYAVILKNINLVKQLLVYDAGKMDSFGSSALDYARKALKHSDPSSPEHTIIKDIIHQLNEYEYKE